MNLADISWEECQTYLEHDDRIVLPIGATEAHGRHLGLGCDFILAEAIARATGERTRLLVAPVLAYGMSYHLTTFPGTLSLAHETLVHVLADLLRSFYRYGFRRVLVVNGHGGNDAPLRSAVVSISEQLKGLRVKSVSWWTEPDIQRIVEQAAGPQRGTHASTHETAFLMAVRPQAAKLEHAAHRDAPVEPSRELLDAQAFAAHYPDGVMGLEPAKATRELGESIFERAVEICVRELENW